MASATLLKPASLKIVEQSFQVFRGYDVDVGAIVIAESQRQPVHLQFEDDADVVARLEIALFAGLDFYFAG